MDKFTDKFFNKILSISEDFEEVFQDLIDIGFEFHISSYYTDSNYKKIPQNRINKVQKYYYGVEINLGRKSVDHTGKMSNGSFIYEEDPTFLKDLYNSIKRLKSQYEEYEIHFYMISNESIHIRVIMGHNENDIKHILDMRDSIFKITNIKIPVINGNEYEIVNSLDGLPIFDPKSYPMLDSSYVIKLSQKSINRIKNNQKCNYMDYNEIVTYLMNHLSKLNNWNYYFDRIRVPSKYIIIGGSESRGEISKNGKSIGCFYLESKASIATTKSIFKKKESLIYDNAIINFKIY